MPCAHVAPTLPPPTTVILLTIYPTRSQLRCLSDSHQRGKLEPKQIAVKMLARSAAGLRESEQSARSARLPRDEIVTLRLDRERLANQRFDHFTPPQRI